MKSEYHVLGIIPARGGSKGIPRKNIYPICDKPLIAYTIESARRSVRLTKLIVSTDDTDIAETARRYGAEVPFLRPAELATDTALAIDVVRHALEFQEKHDCVQYDIVVMLQPTSPLKTAQDIDAVIGKLIKSGCDSVVTMVDVGANHPARMYRVVDDRLVNLMDEGITMRPRQELPPIYIRNGAVYACRRDVIYRWKTLIGPDVRPWIMPLNRSVNIDDPSDIVLAERYLKTTERC